MSATRYRTVAEVAEQLGCCVETVLAHIRAGRLPASNIATRPGRPTWRIAQVDLDLFLAARRPSPAAPRRRRRKVAADLIEYF